jgi:hypothetical protein
MYPNMSVRDDRCETIWQKMTLGFLKERSRPRESELAPEVKVSKISLISIVSKRWLLKHQIVLSGYLPELGEIHYLNLL